MLANPALQTIITHILMELGIPIHRVGFRQLGMAIAIYAADTSRLLSKEIYPVIAAELGFPDWRAVEHAIRDAIVYAWKRRDIAAWEKYFPGCKTAPTNKQFIATLAQHVQ